MQKKIIITGANGFLGSVLCDQLKKTSYRILPFVRKKNNVNDIECDFNRHWEGNMKESEK